MWLSSTIASFLLLVSYSTAAYEAEIAELAEACRSWASYPTPKTSAAHRLTWLATCGVRERERHERGLRLYERKRQLSFKGHPFVPPALEQLRRVA